MITRGAGLICLLACLTVLWCEQMGIVVVQVASIQERL